MRWIEGVRGRAKAQAAVTFQEGAKLKFKVGHLKQNMSCNPSHLSMSQ